MDSESDRFHVLQDPSMGRCLIAKRQLEAGEFLFQDFPLVSGPSRESSIVCLNCYGSVWYHDDCLLCGTCGLPLCKDCSDLNLLADSSSRHYPECFAINKNSRSKNFFNPEELSLFHESILVIRCLYLKEKNLDHWRTLSNLETHSEKRSLGDIERAQNISKVLIGDIGFNSVTFEDINSICGALDTNSFEIPMPSSPGNIQAVYSIGCIPEHSCVPSGHRTFGPDLSLTLRCAINMRPGDRITITYTDSLWTTFERRSHLIYSKHFHCLCDRCRDPTELGSSLGGLKCLKCTDGWVYPSAPLEDESDFCCVSCSSIAPFDWASKVNSEVGQTIKALENSDLTPDQCSKFIGIYSRLLHPQHAHMLDIKHTLLHLLGHHEGYLLSELAQSQLTIKEDLAKTLLRVADTILPGISRLKGTTLYELFLTYRQKALNAHEERKPVKDILELLEEARNSLEESISCLRYEPPHQPEGKLTEKAKEDLNNLSEFVSFIQEIKE